MENILSGEEYLQLTGSLPQNAILRINAELLKFASKILETPAICYEGPAEKWLGLLRRDQDLSTTMGLEQLAAICPLFPQRGLFYDEVKITITAEWNNTVYYLKNRNVIFVTMFYRFNDDFPSSNYFAHMIFASDEQTVLDLAREFDVHEKSLASKYFHLLVDTSKGVSEDIVAFEKNHDNLIITNLMQELSKQIQTFFTNRGEFYKRYKIPHRRGILLYGKPGNGKTSFIHYLAQQNKVPVVSWQVGEYTSSETIKATMEIVNKKTPAILIIEDLDAIPKHCRSAFLNALDGLGTKDGIFIIGTTNYPDQVDPGLKHRAGRFDQTYEFTGPNSEQRYEFLEQRNLQELVTPTEFTRIVASTEGISYANLQEIYVNLMLNLENYNDMRINEVLSHLRSTETHVKRENWFNHDESIGFLPSAKSLEA